MSSSARAIVAVPGIRDTVAHAVPNLTEGVVAPFVAFYLALWVAGPWAGLLAAIAWSYAAIGRRMWRGETTGGLLLLSAVTLTGRAAFTLATGSITAYFLQPAAAKLLVAGALARSASGSRPLLRRLTGDLLNLPAELVDRPEVESWFRVASYGWAALLTAHALIGVWLLLSLPIEVYVAVKTVLNVAVKGGGLAASVWHFRRMAARAGIEITFGSAEQPIRAGRAVSYLDAQRQQPVTHLVRRLPVPAVAGEPAHL